MWHHELNKVSRSILSDHYHDFVSLSCKQFKPNQDLEYGLPIQNGKSVFFMIKPNSNTLGFYVFSDEKYHSALSKLGDVEDSKFNFSEITDKKLFLAVHKDGHFYEKINIVDVIREIFTFAHLNDVVFLLQLDRVDLNLSYLRSRISSRLVRIRKPITVRSDSGNYTKNHKEKNRDLDVFGDEIIKSLDSGLHLSIVVWCFSSESPSVSFAGSKASISWVNVDSEVISENVGFGNKFKRLFKKTENERVGDIFNTGKSSHHLLGFNVSKVIHKEKLNYLGNRKNAPAFLFDGDFVLHQKNIESSKTVDSDNLTVSESLEDVGY